MSSEEADKAAPTDPLFGIGLAWAIGKQIAPRLVHVEVSSQACSLIFSSGVKLNPPVKNLFAF